ncbi:unnamed protein product [marine sediment metagenome]|uniref:Uncharacterized protein n=1 Tax=marine sediment metagenome TaxID=412755 RepID=X0VN16_9ZZZZ
MKSIREGTKWAVFSPEQSPPMHFYLDLMRQYEGTDKLPDWKEERARKFIDAHFFYVFPKDNAPTPHYIREVFYDLHQREKIDGCVIDPFNQLANDWAKNKRDDQYLDSFLSDHKRFGMDLNLYNVIIAHPKGMQLIDGEYPCPRVYDFAGGAMWNNKCDNILQYHRPNYQQDPSDPTCQFVSQKIKKQRANGIPGTVEMEYDRDAFRFLINGRNPLNEDQEPTIKPNYEAMEDAPF